jgi:hypothetical protein
MATFLLSQLPGSRFDILWYDDDDGGGEFVGLVS